MRAWWPRSEIQAVLIKRSWGENLSAPCNVFAKEHWLTYRRWLCPNMTEKLLNQIKPESCYNDEATFHE